MTLDITRRSMLGCIAVSGGLMATRLAAAPQGHPKGLLLIDGALGEAEQRLIIARYRAAQVIRLDGEVVRQWRSSLRHRVLENGGAVALAPWAQSRILFDLAREEGGAAQIDPYDRRNFEVRLTIPSVS